jgi:hypothetical protein
MESRTRKYIVIYRRGGKKWEDIIVMVKKDIAKDLLVMFKMPKILIVKIANIQMVQVENIKIL